MILHRHRFNAMGCPCELRFHAERKDTLVRALDLCRREIERFERKYSRYRPDSVTTAIARGAGRAPVPIDRETASLLEYAALCHEQSGGRFDITSGVLRHVWRRGRKTLPSRRELEACRAKVGWNKVRYSEGSVYLPLAGMELDFGGVVKEYAADAAAVLARNAGIRHGLVNLGGDICIVGPQPGGRPWPIAVVHPRRRDSAIATVLLEDGALATSGGYERFIEMEGHRYSHLIDPRTGWPVEGLESVSVVADQAIVAGSLASIALLGPPADGLDWLERCGAPYLAIDSRLRCHGRLLDTRGREPIGPGGTSDAAIRASDT